MLRRTAAGSGVTWCLGAAMALGLATWGAAVHGQVSQRPDCELVEVVIPPPAGIETPDEKAARLEQAFIESLKAYDKCQAELTREGGGGGGGGGGSGGGGGGGGVSGSAAGSGDTSAAAADGRGDAGTSTQAKTADKPEPPRDSTQSGSGAPRQNQAPATNTSPPRPTSGGSGGVGKDDIDVPPDIPSGRDDDIVAQQIREAAMKETDPVIREKLWDDYRKYKGSPSR